MAIHPDITPPDDRAAGAVLALRALREARSPLTAPAGIVSVRNPDGTSTVIGGPDGDISRYVGDTTPPGRPTGVTAGCLNGIVWASWDGTLEGGLPADFEHVAMLADGQSGTVELGWLREAGTVTSSSFAAGSSLEVYATAHDWQDNASGPSERVAVKVSDPVAEADRRLDEVSAKADAASGKADDLSREVEEKTQAARDAADAAGKTASDALERAAAAQQDVDGFRATVSETYQTKADAEAAARGANLLRNPGFELGDLTGWEGSGASWAVNGSGALHSGSYRALSPCSEGLTWLASEPVAVTPGQVLSVSAWVYCEAGFTVGVAAGGSPQAGLETVTAEGAGAYQRVSLRHVVADGTSSLRLRVACRAAPKAHLRVDDCAVVDMTDADVTYATRSQLSQTASGIEAKVTETRNVADAAQRSASDLKVTVDGLSSDVTRAQETADGAVDRAAHAQQTADGLSSRVTEAYDSATEALSKATSAEQTADGVKTTVERDYLSKGDAQASYASKSDLEQTASSIRAEVSEGYVDKATGETYARASDVKVTTDAISAEVSKKLDAADAEATYTKATEFRQTAEDITASVRTAQQTADGKVSKGSSGIDSLDTTMQLDQSGLSVYRKANGEVQGFITRMTGSDFQVCDKSGTALSRFTSSGVELGRNSSGATISMCGGKGSVAFEGGTTLALRSAGAAVVSSVKNASSARYGTLTLDGGSSMLRHFDDQDSSQGSYIYCADKAVNVAGSGGSYNLMQSTGTLSLSGVRARNAWKPRYIRRGGLLLLMGQITGLSADATICNLSSLVNSFELPSSGVNRHFAVALFNGSGARVSSSVYLTSAGLLKVTGSGSNLSGSAWIDLSGIVLSAK